MTSALLGLDVFAPTRTVSRRATLARVLAGMAATAALISAAGLPASAAPGQTDTGSTIANVAVESAIELTGLTPSFTLTGIPGANVAKAEAVAMNVATNNIAGYAVTVQAAAPALLPADTVANPDSIPVSALSVRESGTTTYDAISDSAPATVHSQATRSALGGDTVSNDYRVAIPFVNSDTYSVTLDYLATTL